MTVKELISELKCFSGHHNVRIEVLTEAGFALCSSEIQEIRFENMECVLYGSDLE